MLVLRISLPEFQPDVFPMAPFLNIDIRDDTSVIDLGSNQPADFIPGTLKRKVGETPSPRSAKRRANDSGGFAAISEGSSSLATKRSETPPPALKKSNKDGHRSTKLRVTDCESRLAQHDDLILDQDRRIGEQEDRMTQHRAEIEILDSRLKLVEENSSVNEHSGSTGESRNQVHPSVNVDELQQSVEDLARKLKSRTGYIRTEKRAKDRLEVLSNDLVVQKGRLKGCQEEVTEHTNRLGDLESSLKKKAPLGRVKKLSTRLDELEKKLTGERATTGSAPDVSFDITVDGDGSRALSQLEARVRELEKMADTAQVLMNAPSALDEIFHHLESLEKYQADLKPASESSRAALETQITRQGQSLRKWISDIDHELRHSYRPPSWYNQRR
ncbi:hypothetical protein VTK56DRAFT_9727 [Thermocarpiscus australiensis]